jgi:hypothetical protein
MPAAHSATSARMASRLTNEGSILPVVLVSRCPRAWLALRPRWRRTAAVAATEALYCAVVIR